MLCRGVVDERTVNIGRARVVLTGVMTMTAT
jgi:hypothetical protein